MTSSGRFAGVWVLSVLLAFTSAGEALELRRATSTVPAHRQRATATTCRANVAAALGRHSSRAPSGSGGSATHRRAGRARVEGAAADGVPRREHVRCRRSSKQSPVRR